MYILHESVMNGTVTMNNYIAVINTNSFEKAVEKIKQTISTWDAVIITDDGERFVYKIKNGALPLIERIENKEVSIIEV